MLASFERRRDYEYNTRGGQKRLHVAIQAVQVSTIGSVTFGSVEILSRAEKRILTLPCLHLIRLFLIISIETKLRFLLETATGETAEAVVREIREKLRLSPAGGGTGGGRGVNTGVGTDDEETEAPWMADDAKGI